MTTEQLNLPMPDQEQAAPQSLEEQVAAMEAAQNPEAAPEPAPSEPTRPEWLPEKFKTPEDLAKSYGELEKKLGSREQSPQMDGLITSAEQEFMENGGELSEETIENFEKMGIPRAFVEQVRDMRVREAEQNRQAIINEFGGDEMVSQMQAWAGQSYDEPMIERLNDMLNSNDVTTVKMAMNQIRTDFASATGAQEPRQTVSGRGQAAPEGFRSTAEMVAAMQDPRYRKDPAFRQEVERKVAAM